MDRVPGELRAHRSVELSKTFTAGFTDRTDSKGHDHVAVQLEQNLPGDTGRKLWTELDRLERVVQRADEYQKSRERTERVEKVGPYEVRLNRYHSDKVGETVAVRIEQRFSDEPAKSQWFMTTVDRLKEVVKEGHAVEQGLGYGPKWHNLVYADSLKSQEGSRVEAKLFKSVESEEQARLVLKDNPSLALAPEPTRRPLQSEKSVELWRGEFLESKGGVSRTVDDQLARNEWSRERIGEHFIVARWNDISRRPGIGEKVVWEGSGQAYNGALEDFKAHPVARSEPGEAAEPTFVLIRRGEHRTPNGTIEAISGKREELTAKLAQCEKMERDHRAISSEWNKQTLGTTRSY